MAECLISVILIFSSCCGLQDPGYEFEAREADAGLTRVNGIEVLRGSSVFALDDHFVWGASVLRDTDGLYYMVFSASECGEYPFADAWVYGSKFGLAVSERPDGDFRFLDFFYNIDGFREDCSSWDAQTVSNPHLRTYCGRYYLYYCGSADPGSADVKGSINRRARIQQSQKVGVLIFDSFRGLLAGEFEKPDLPLIIPRTRVKPDNVVAPSPPGTEPMPDNLIAVNPSVVYRPADGKYLLYFKGNVYDPVWRGIHGVAVGDRPDGPFVPVDKEVFVIKAGQGKLSAEDPYVWYCRRDKCFYAVFKDFTGAFTRNVPCLAFMYSADGIEWYLPDNSIFIKKELVLGNGNTVVVDRLERPQLFLDSLGMPAILYAACAVEDINRRTEGGTFNVQIRLTYSK